LHIVQYVCSVVGLQEQMNSAMSALMTDSDRDVAHAARAVHDRFKKTPLRVTGGAGVLDMNGLAGAQGDVEAVDRAKEEAEADFTFAPDEMDK
jgi:hypothetical protein